MLKKHFDNFLHNLSASTQNTLGGAICQIVNNGNQVKLFQNQEHTQLTMQMVVTAEVFI